MSSEFYTVEAPDGCRVALRLMDVGDVCEQIVQESSCTAPERFTVVQMRFGTTYTFRDVKGEHFDRIMTAIQGYGDAEEYADAE